MVRRISWSRPAPMGRLSRPGRTTSGPTSCFPSPRTGARWSPICGIERSASRPDALGARGADPEERVVLRLHELREAWIARQVTVELRLAQLLDDDVGRAEVPRQGGVGLHDLRRRASRRPARDARRALEAEE